MAIKRNLIPGLNILIPFFGSNTDRFMSVKRFDVSKILGIGLIFTLDDVTRFKLLSKALFELGKRHRVWVSFPETCLTASS